MMKLWCLTIMIGLLPVCSYAAQKQKSLPEFSGEFLYAVRTDEDTRAFEQQLAETNADQLVKGLPDDVARKTFWINIYNAWYQILAGRERLTAPDIFNSARLSFKGFKLSLDDIEHGILRKYRAKYGLGVVPDVLAGQTIRALAVEEPDFRIHFALNCGAKSCPPIAFYIREKLDQQLELATAGFLKADSRIDERTRTVSVTRIMEWFIGDFGGKPGQRKILSRYLGRDFSKWAIAYHDYDWTPQLKNFSFEKP